ncbi:hypothetical protein Tco_0358942 [Tanacetum coccineum]
MYQFSNDSFRDNASSAVTYTSISSDSNKLSWGIQLVNAGELLEMDPYEKHPRDNLADSDSMEDDTDADSINYPDEPEDDEDDDDTDDEDEEPTEDEKEEEHPAPADIFCGDLYLLLLYLAPPPGCDVAESSVAAAARPPRGQYDFVDTVEAGQGLICSPGHDARTIARAADRAEDVGYVHRQESADFHTQLLDAWTDRRDIRLEIDVVRGQRTAYET